MKTKFNAIIGIAILVMLAASIIGCQGAASEPAATSEPTVTAPTDAPDPNWQWPEKIYVTAAGTSGM